MRISVKPVYDRRRTVANELANRAPVELEIYQSNPKIRKYVPTGISIEKEQWDERKKQVNKKHPSAPHFNKLLRDASQAIEEYAYSLYATEKVLTIQLLEQFLKGRKDNKNSFLDFFEIEIDPALKRGTRKEHQYTLNMLREFKSEILFSEINYTLIDEFDRFMRNDKGLMQNTIYKHHQHINRFLRQAALKELIDANKNPYNTFKSKKEKSDRISLSIDELKAIESIDTQAYPELVLVKDMFLFSCYTGLRFSDVTSLEYSHLINTKEGLTIVKKMEKVPKPITLPLTLLFKGKPNMILQPYLTENTGLVFPPITNQHANRLLKVIATITQTPMRLTFHIARHTFGTMLADATQNPYLIMDLMGHADIKTSMIYIHRSQERISKQLRGVKWENIGLGMLME